jgi:hypothetical protein
MRNAKVDTQTESHSYPDSLVVQSKAASRDGQSMEPIAAVGCRNSCKAAFAYDVIRAAPHYGFIVLNAGPVPSALLERG